MIYTCGFIFNEAHDRVLLMRKLRPEWQKGKFNGIGGKWEEGVDRLLIDTMIREAKEETTIGDVTWKEFANLRFKDRDDITFYYTTTEFNNIKPRTDEILMPMAIKDIFNPLYYFYHDIIPNLRPLIAIALDGTFQRPMLVQKENPWEPVRQK